MENTLKGLVLCGFLLTTGFAQLETNLEIDSTFKNASLEFKSKTFMKIKTAYEYSGTCYNQEIGQNHVCPHGSLFSEDCYYEDVIVDVPYSCTKVGVKDKAFPDGGKSEIKAVVKIGNTEILEDLKIPLKVSVNQGVSGLGKDIQIEKPDNKNPDFVIIYDGQNKVEINQVDEYLSKVNVEASLEFLDYRPVKQILSEKFKIDEITTSGLEFKLPAFPYNPENFRLSISVRSKGVLQNIFGYPITKSKKLSELDVIETSDGANIKIDWNEFGFKKIKSRKYEISYSLSHYNNKIWNKSVGYQTHKGNKKYLVKMNIKKGKVEVLKIKDSDKID